MSEIAMIDRKGIKWRRIRHFIIISITTLAIAGCAITKPPGLSCGNELLPLVDGTDLRSTGSFSFVDELAAENFDKTTDTVTISILTLSGGGKYGAFGAGFLGGWSEAERIDPKVPIRRGAIDIVTGISTGSLLASYAAVGNASPDAKKPTTDPCDPTRDKTNIRQTADCDAKIGYQVSDKDLFRKQSKLSLLTSNAQVDPTGRADKRVGDMVEKYAPLVAKLPDDHLVLVGAANLTNGKFYYTDMKQVAANGKDANACYAEWLLASSAVPGLLPPRFIDNHGYVDGGVRFGAFLGAAIAHIKGRTNTPGDPLENAKLHVNLIALFNNPLTANSPSRNPAAAVKCNRSTLADAHEHCKDFTKKNDVLGVVERSAGDIMSHQIYLDSVYRLQRELEATKVLKLSKFIYAAPKDISKNKCAATSTDNYDTTFMKCLYDLGFKIGKNSQRWRDFGDMPHF